MTTTTVSPQPQTRTVTEPAITRRGFWLRLALYTLPFALAFATLTGALIYTGESMPLGWVVAHQMGDEPVLYRPRFGSRDFAFKQLSTEARQPEVLAVGSSRVLQMRAGFFNEQPGAFYNAGAPAWTLPRVVDFVTSLDEAALPDILIIGLDHPWFNDAYVGDPFAPEPSDFATIFNVNRSFMQAVIDGESFDVGLYLRRTEPNEGGLALGLRAIRDGHGFRNDGSEQYGDFLVAHHLWPVNERQRHIDYAANNQAMYVWGDTASESALAQLDRLLAFAAAHDMTVIGFTPPYMPTLWDQMMASGNFGYIDLLIPRLRDLFDEYDFAYFDFSDGDELGATDDDFFDGWHASERIYLRLYIEMLRERPDLLGLFSDLDDLRAIEENATDTFEVFAMATP